MAGSKVAIFPLHSFLACLIISGTLRLTSLVNMSEEAGIQFFGPDNVAIWKVRFITVSSSSFIALLLMNDSGGSELIFYPGTKVTQVILIIF